MLNYNHETHALGYNLKPANLILIRTKFLCGQRALLLPWTELFRVLAALQRFAAIISSPRWPPRRQRGAGPDSPIRRKTGRLQVHVMPPPWLHASRILARDRFKSDSDVFRDWNLSERTLSCIVSWVTARWTLCVHVTGRRQQHAVRCTPRLAEEGEVDQQDVGVEPASRAGRSSVPQGQTAQTGDLAASTLCPRKNGPQVCLKIFKISKLCAVLI